ncbi:MAG: nucleotidyltransferase domain-containing protein [Opitutaceae bacterium]
MKLEVFGSVARGESRRGSDVDLIATFVVSPGLGFFSMADDMAFILGVPVDLLTHETVEEMTNPFRKQAINRDRRIIYAA